MSKQYLEAHTFLKTLRDKGVPYTETLVNLMQYAVIEEVAPVVHAYWKNKHFNYASPTETEAVYFVNYVCSNCNTTWKYASNYCPNCGARMDGGRNDG